MSRSTFVKVSNDLHRPTEDELDTGDLSLVQLYAFRRLRSVETFFEKIITFVLPSFGILFICLYIAIAAYVYHYPILEDLVLCY